MRKKFTAVLFFSILLSLLACVSVTAANPVCQVKYGRLNDGKYENTYENWNVSAETGQEIRTRYVADRNGYRCYWRVKNGNTYEDVRSGDTYTVIKNTNFFIKWKKLYTVDFYNPKGTVRHSKETITLTYGEKFYLPRLPDTTNYKFVGWAREKNAQKAVYDWTRKYAMRHSLTLYAVYQQKENYTVEYYNWQGTSEYKSLRMTKKEGTLYSPPKLSDTVRYMFVGWSRYPNQTTASFVSDETYVASGNIRLYAVYTKKPNMVTLRYANGKFYQKIPVDGKTVKFPTVGFGGTYTFQGWSRTSGKSCAPDYFEDQVIPDKAATYYMVVANAASEVPYTRIKESSKYRYVYFVGDSRTEDAKNKFGQGLSKTRFVAKGGKGYAWLTEQGGGYDQLLQMIKADNKTTNKKKAVVFCLGVNDMRNIDSYIAFYKKKAAALKKLGCDLYVMSVNPFCVGQRLYWCEEHGADTRIERRTQKARINFNDKLMTELKGIYQYIDTFTYLKKTGWPTMDRSDSPTPDGLHYTTYTTARIYAYALKVMG